MEFNCMFGGQELNGGIYKITNRQNGRVYIGSAKQLKNRFKSHNASLISDRHSNRFLQSDYNKCGKENFVFEILEIIVNNKEERLLKEDVYISQYYDNQQNCYNFQKTATSSEGNFPKDPEVAKKRRSAAAKASWGNDIKREHILAGRSEKMSESWRVDEKRKTKLSARSKKLWLNEKYAEMMHEAHTSEENLAHLLEIQKEAVAKRIKSFSLVSPEGEIHEGKNISKFAKEHGLDFRHLSAIVKGDEKSHKGWRTVENKDYHHEEKRTYDIKLVSPEGTVYGPIVGLCDFAREHGFFKGNLRSLINGDLKSCMGWKIDDGKSKRPRSQKNSYSFMSPEGVVYKDIKNLTEFAEQFGLWYSGFCSLVSGRLATYHKWRLVDKS